ncbi:MAG: tetratricopeptide repeat protein [Leptolyngbya sp. Prado105]|jgi:tetratricopeptide (TPR) repeat protein|nr:tetratricopeptide repeat protein [Leptolyngbya sp. Prado105]
MNSLEQGCDCCQQGNFLAALTHFDRAIQADSTCATAWNYRANALSGLKRYAEALRDYDRAVLLKPDYHQAWFNRGAMLTEIGAYGNAIESYDRAIQHKPDPVYTHARASISVKQQLVFT